MTRTILVDGDIALYEVCTSCEVAVDWGDDLWTLHCDLREACQKFDGWMARVLERTEADKAIVALSGPQNWRKDVLPSYKHNRKPKRKPLAFKPLKNYVRESYRTYEFENLEADDVLGLLAGNPGLANLEGQKVIVTIDKDLMTIPGFHYYTNKPEDGIIQVSEEQANFNHLLQSLAGDATDGYSGCPGIGPVRAERLLLENPCWDQVMDAYDNAGLSEEDALTQARVARILRWGEYNTETKEVTLWQP